MKTRKLLIIIISIIILLMFGLVSYVSYNMGISYGEQHAEEIRESRISESLLCIANNPGIPQFAKYCFLSSTPAPLGETRATSINFGGIIRL